MGTPFHRVNLKKYWDTNWICWVALNGTMKCDAPTCIDIIYILHVMYIFFYVSNWHCKCVSINKYCLFSIVYCNTYNIRVAPNGTMKCDAIHTICLRVINSDNNVQKAWKVSKIITFHSTGSC
jgi:hypothetical protein